MIPILEHVDDQQALNLNTLLCFWSNWKPSNHVDKISPFRPSPSADSDHVQWREISAETPSPRNVQTRLWIVHGNVLLMSMILTMPGRFSLEIRLSRRWIDAIEVRERRMCRSWWRGLIAVVKVDIVDLNPLVVISTMPWESKNDGSLNSI